MLPVKRAVKIKVLCRQSSNRLAVFLCCHIVVFMVFNRSHQAKLALDPFRIVIWNVSITQEL